MMVKYLNKAIDDIKMSRKVEKGIYNYVIKVSKEKIYKEIVGKHFIYKPL